MKNTLLTLIIAFVCFISCNSSDDSTPIDNTSVVLLKSIIYTEDDGSTYSINYLYNGSKIIGYTDSYNDSAIYTYSGELLTQIDELIDGDIDDGTTTFEYDSNNRLITETYTYPGFSSQVNTYNYNANGTITLNENNINEYVYTFVDGNLINVEQTDGNQDYTLTYDDKNNPFKNIHQRDVIGLFDKEAYKNNVLTYVNTGGATFPDDYTMTYTYNSNNYPITAVETYNPGTADEEISTVQYIYE